MPVVVRFEIFSGRTNPQFELTGEQEIELSERVSILRTRSKRQLSSRAAGLPVIRVIRTSDKGRRVLLIGGGIVHFSPLPFGLQDDGIGKWLIDICPPSILPHGLTGEQILALIDWWTEKLSKYRPPPATVPPSPPPCDPCPAADAVPFTEDWPPNPTFTYSRLWCNNCYDYANLQVTDTFSQPGYGSGEIYASHTCADMSAAAVRDGLLPVPNCTDPLGVGNGWYVALIIGEVGDAPDFHWLKQDSSGCWSHKLGINGATFLDFHGHPIRSPQTANFTLPGYPIKYDQFCSCFVTTPAVTIKGLDPTTNCWDMGY